jgi:hypothetical protein
MIDTLSGIKFEGTTKHTHRYQRQVKLSEISELAVYLHITYIYRQAPQLSEMTSPIEKSFEYAKTNTCTSVERVM